MNLRVNLYIPRFLQKVRSTVLNISSHFEIRVIYSLGNIPVRKHLEIYEDIAQKVTSSLNVTLFLVSDFKLPP